MSNSHKQSLDDQLVFEPVTESNPEFLYSEEQRYAFECLLSDGPEAFYSKLNTERPGPFLSPYEVSQVSSWVEDRRKTDSIENGDDDTPDTDDFSLKYFPKHSDSSAPCLDLGWPEKDNWGGVNRAEVYTNPPVGQAPHIREVIRKQLQGATMLIAIVADRLTDSTVIGDLHSAASRGVVVYIILNRRAAQENLTPQKLQHPKIVVRILEGKSFLSRDGKMVVGELKENFILVDLLTVVLGSYSLTWIDAHLHRQLVTVMSGPAVELFDREFRILFAASLPVPESWDTPRTEVQPKSEVAHSQDHPKLSSQKPGFTERVPSPPPPTADSPIDWEALGVFHKCDSTEEDDILLPKFCETLPNYSRRPFNWYPGYNDTGREMGAKELHIAERHEENKLHHVAAEPRHVYDYPVMYGNTPKPERVQYNFLPERHERLSTRRYRELKMEKNFQEEPVPFSHVYRQEFSLNKNKSLEENDILDKTMPLKKPLILSIPQTGSSMNLNEILKKVNSGPNTKGLQQKGFKPTFSKSTLDLSTQETDGASKTQAYLYDGYPITPALALMKKRNDEVKSSFLQNTQPQSRPHSFSFGLQREKWKPSFLRGQNNEENK